jgi:glycosyltransferase involved in cell wall biosynthesis
MNEERNIAACLDSLVDWADDVVVVDSGSTDRTLTLCAERGVQTIFHEYVDARSQRRWALSAVPWKHDWLFVVDADHRVTPELQQDIQRALRTDAGMVHGYYVRHVRHFRNRLVRGQKSWSLQIIRRSRSRVDESELVDFRFIVDGATGRLPGAIVETNQNEADIDTWIDKHQAFARRMAIEDILRREGRLGWAGGLTPRLFGSPDERAVWLKNLWYGLPLFVRPVLYFLYRYFLRLGIADGWNGLVFHVFQSFWFRLLVDIHISDYRQQLKQRTISLDDLMALSNRGTAGQHG